MEHLGRVLVRSNVGFGTCLTQFGFQLIRQVKRQGRLSRLMLAVCWNSKPKLRQDVFVHQPGHVRQPEVPA